MWVVYERPTDFPDGYIARRWEVTVDGPKATPDTVQVDGTASDEGLLEGLRMMLTSMDPNLTFMPRNEEDDPVIVETWL